MLFLHFWSRWWRRRENIYILLIFLFFIKRSIAFSTFQIQLHDDKTTILYRAAENHLAVNAIYSLFYYIYSTTFTKSRLLCFTKFLPLLLLNIGSIIDHCLSVKAVIYPILSPFLKISYHYFVTFALLNTTSNFLGSLQSTTRF